MKKILILLMMTLATCNLLAKSNFVQVKNDHFVRDGTYQCAASSSHDHLRQKEAGSFRLLYI